MQNSPNELNSSSERTGKARKRKFHDNQFHNVSSSDNGEANTRRSKKKLASETTDDIVIYPSHCYRIIEFVSVFLAISELVICNSCKQRIKFSESGHRILGFKIVLSCKCGKREIQSGPLIHTAYEINRRIVFVMRLLGVAREGLNIFCSLMDMSQGFIKPTYDNAVDFVYTASKIVFESVCKKAVEEEKELNIQNERPADHLKVSNDRSWKKRGPASLYSVTTLIGYYSGKVIDLDVKSGYCYTCSVKKNSLNNDEFKNWYKNHAQNCLSNYAGSSGNMEVDSMLEMFSRSMEKFGVMYNNYNGDGNTKTSLSILNSNPYGDECTVTRNKCVRHVQKRMAAHFRYKKKQDKLDKKNIRNVKESFKSTLWHIAPTHLNLSCKIIEIAAYIAGGMFNEGYSTVLKIMQLLDLKIGQQCNDFARGFDEERAIRQNKLDLFLRKKSREPRRL
ncbi:hypothetical protein M0802_010098 [Mischocyttarus mexicanus]|nr:hypothetical protein M0802_010098 [Mischocyttarus mexicanus]